MSALRKIAELSENIGYRRDAILDNYAFSDVSQATSNEAQQVELAVFTQTPPSYRSAAFGAAHSSGAKPEEIIRRYRALGAPLFFVIGEDEVSVWQVYASGAPRELERSKVSDLSALFEKQKELWSPEAIHRAKSIGRIDPSYQLDFVDAGLMPSIEGEIHEKLDRLLKDVLSNAKIENDDDRVRQLFQGVFRLLAAKILIDRNHESTHSWNSGDVTSVLNGIGEYYGLANQFLLDPEVLDDLKFAWNVLSQGVNVANISADDLAFVYENTLVTKETRKAYGTHSTPRHVAEYVVQRLGLWQYKENPPSVFEPFCGAGVFLVSALRHMREFLPTSWSDRQRHDFLVKKIRGAEIDAFACEVATLSLILADYPNKNGWKIENSDLFSNDALEKSLRGADIILCNPPYEVFDEQEREKYPYISSQSGSKAIAVLSAAIESEPDALGFVLPRTFLMDQAYRRLRKMIEQRYREVELVSLPDGVFSVSQIETALLIARDPTKNAELRHIVSSEVVDKDKKKFAFTGIPSFTRQEDRYHDEEATGRLWIPPLGPIWRRLSHLPTLGDYFSGHWGIRWKNGGQASAIADGDDQNSQLGLLRAHDHRQFCTGKPIWLDTTPEKLYAGGKLDWPQPKILCNAARMSRGYWRLAAAVDDTGLVASQQFIGLWPKAGANPQDLYAAAAVLNSPVANAFMTDHSTEKRFRIRTLEALPFPEELPEKLGQLAQRYCASVKTINFQAEQDGRSSHLLDQMDELILEAYDLPPRMVRSLLSAFGNQPRPVLHNWDPWGVSTDDPAMTLKEIRNNILDQSREDWLRQKLSTVPASESDLFSTYFS